MEYIGNDCEIKTLADSDIGHWIWTIDTGTGVYIHNLKLNGNMNYQTIPHPAVDYYFPYMPNDGIVLRENARFENNEVYNYGGYMIEVYKGNNVVISNNTIHTGWQYGIALAGSSSDYANNATVADNVIYDMGEVGIKTLYTSNSLITRNTITMPAKYDLFTSSSPHNTGVGEPDGSPEPSGIRFYSSDGANSNVNFTDNDIYGTGGNDEAAVRTDSSTYSDTNNRITLNNIYTAENGILLGSKFSTGTVTGNVITYTSVCVSDGGTGNTVSGNTCTVV
jgi:hypothetical protein